MGGVCIEPLRHSQVITIASEQAGTYNTSIGSKHYIITNVVSVRTGGGMGGSLQDALTAGRLAVLFFFAMPPSL